MSGENHTTRDGFRPTTFDPRYSVNEDGVVLGVYGEPVAKRLIGRGTLYYAVAINRDHIRGNDRVRVYRLVHRLVYEAFVGPIPDGMQVAHINGNPLDNRLSNLKLCTPKENNADKRIHGTLPIGERHHKAKLTEGDVCRIRELRRSGKTYREIAEIVNISLSTVSHVANRRTWTHIP